MALGMSRKERHQYEDEKGGREDWNCKSNARRRKKKRKPDLAVGILN